MGWRDQPQCGAGTEEGCSHPISFHGGGKTRCRALGCKCEKWHPPAKEPESDGEAVT